VLIDTVAQPLRRKRAANIGHSTDAISDSESDDGDGLLNLEVLMGKPAIPKPIR
jgi:hypothetical protein